MVFLEYFLRSLLFLAGSCVFYLAIGTRNRQLPLPPVPADRTIHDEHTWSAYARWSKGLGPLITLPTIGRSIIVLNTYHAANDLLVKRKSFACRPRFPMAELMGRQNNVGFTYYGERLRKMRSALHSSLNATAVWTTWIELLDAQSLSLCRDLLNSPDSFYESLETNMQKLIVRFTYGQEPDAEYIQVANRVMHDTGRALQPGQWIIDSFPILKWLPVWMPGASFKRWAEGAKSAFNKMTRDPFRRAKNDIIRESANDSFVRTSLMKLVQPPSDADEDIVVCAAGSLFSAGTETLSGTLLTFILLMVHHEDIQKRAYNEITEIVGVDRLPGPEDRNSLPFVEAIIKEVHRFNPAVPLATHSNSQEEQYQGHRIPQKTWVLANIWSMLHDEETYFDPQKFIPDRFIPQNVVDITTDPRTMLYGFGRRRCPGAHFADATVFLIVSRILALFHLSPDIEGLNTGPPPLDFIQAFVPTPKPFKCTIVPRRNAKEILARTIT